MENTAAFPIDYTAAFSVRTPSSRQTHNRFVRRDGWSGLAFWRKLRRGRARNTAS